MFATIITGTAISVAYAGFLRWCHGLPAFSRAVKKPEANSFEVLTGNFPNGDEFKYVQLQTAEEVHRLFNGLKDNLANVCGSIYAYTETEDKGWPPKYCVDKINDVFEKGIAKQVIETENTYRAYKELPKVYIKLPINLTESDLSSLGFKQWDEHDNEGFAVWLIPQYLKHVLYPLYTVTSISNRKTQIHYLDRDEDERFGCIAHGLRIPEIM